MTASNQAAALRDRLWANASDSVSHALDHLDGLGSRRNREHHVKWAILSATHAGECLCKALVLLLNPTPDAVLERNGKRFIGFEQSMSALHSLGRQALKPAETRLLKLFGELLKTRGEITHRVVPTEMDVSVAAIATLGIIRVGRARIDEASPHVSWGGWDRQAAFEAIRHTRVEEYCRESEKLLHAQYPEEHFGYCAMCWAHSVWQSRCEVCFEDVDSFECPESGEPVYYGSFWTGRGAFDFDCPHCFSNHSVE